MEEADATHQKVSTYYGDCFLQNMLANNDPFCLRIYMDLTCLDDLLNPWSRSAVPSSDNDEPRSAPLANQSQASTPASTSKQITASTTTTKSSTIKVNKPCKSEQPTKSVEKEKPC